MKMPRPKTPPTTRNAEAQALIDAAVSRCEGCRTNWRLKPGKFVHPVPGGTVQCWAQSERGKLRYIAAQRRK